MTDRIKGLIVSLDIDIREDDAQAIIEAIRQIRHVVGVGFSLFTADDLINRMRIRADFEERIWKALKEEHDFD
jgi:phosphate starvation-inducible protein PhoH